MGEGGAVTLTVTPCPQRVSLARHTWVPARGLPASWEADAVFVEDMDDEEDVTEHASKCGQGGDVLEEARHLSGWTTHRAVTCTCAEQTDRAVHHPQCPAHIGLPPSLCLLLTHSSSSPAPVSIFWSLIPQPPSL